MRGWRARSSDVLNLPALYGEWVWIDQSGTQGT
jgi:hypothetical protein